MADEPDVVLEPLTPQRQMSGSQAVVKEKAKLNKSTKQNHADKYIIYF
jgi:hypothetical protein